MVKCEAHLTLMYCLHFPNHLRFVFVEFFSIDLAVNQDIYIRCSGLDSQQFFWKEAQFFERVFALSWKVFRVL